MRSGDVGDTLTQPTEQHNKNAPRRPTSVSKVKIARSEEMRAASHATPSHADTTRATRSSYALTKMPRAPKCQMTGRGDGPSAKSGQGVHMFDFVSTAMPTTKFEKRTNATKIFSRLTKLKLNFHKSIKFCNF
jgi:hypothetical protein